MNRKELGKRIGILNNQIKTLQRKTYNLQNNKIKNDVIRMKIDKLKSNIRQKYETMDYLQNIYVTDQIILEQEDIKQLKRNGWLMAETEEYALNLKIRWKTR